MPINLELIEDGHILWFQVDEPWNADDIPPAKEKSRRIFQQAQHTVHSLVDLRRAKVNLPLLTAAQQVIGGEPFPNSGQIAIVGVSGMMQLIIRPALMVTGNADTLRFFKTFEEAKAHLRRQISQK